MSIKTDAAVEQLEKRAAELEGKVEFLRESIDSIWKEVVEMKNQKEVRVTQQGKKNGRGRLSDHQ